MGKSKSNGNGKTASRLDEVKAERAGVMVEMEKLSAERDVMRGQLAEAKEKQAVLVPGAFGSSGDAELRQKLREINRSILDFIQTLAGFDESLIHLSARRDALDVEITELERTAVRGKAAALLAERDQAGQSFCVAISASSESLLVAAEKHDAAAMLLAGIGERLDWHSFARPLEEIASRELVLRVGSRHALTLSYDAGRRLAKKAATEAAQVEAPAA